MGMAVVPSNDFHEPNPTASKRLMSETDQIYARANIIKHGDNYNQMAMDIKTNNLQMTERQLEKLCKRFLNLPEDQIRA